MIINEIKQTISNELIEVEIELKEMIDSDVTIIRQVAQHLLAYKGKRLRPIILLLCSGLVGNINKTSIKLAAMIELLHTATLIHDDVVDESDIRRGGPSIHSKWNNKTSILMGDYLFSILLFTLSKIQNFEIIHLLSKTVKQIIRGELIQLQNKNKHTISEKTYIELISDKTASLLSATCELGMIAAGQNENQNHSNLRDFGQNLGIAFQIRDDILDFTGAVEITGKPILKDLVGNIITLPLIHALRSNSNGKKSYEKIKDLQNQDIASIRQFVKKSGSIEYTLNKANHYKNKALLCLNTYKDSQYKTALIQLTEFMITREY